VAEDGDFVDVRGAGVGDDGTHTAENGTAVGEGGARLDGYGTLVPCDVAHILTDGARLRLESAKDAERSARHGDDGACP
jgi:hypothetical protein